MESECKIFVGNVPFQCNQNEFAKCFEKMQGFVKAEIVCKSDMTVSRGFGFLTFDTKENARKIIGNNSIMFKDRLLRFTEYIHTKDTREIHNEKNKMLDYDSDDDMFNIYDEKLEDIIKSSQNTNEIKISIRQKNLIVVKNIKPETTREYLYNVFCKYGEVGRHFISIDQETGARKNYGVVEIINEEIFENLLKEKEIHIDGMILELSRWKLNKNNNYNNYNNQKSSFKKKIYCSHELFS